MNFGPYPMSHGLTRLQSRFQADPADLERAQATIGEALDAEEAEALGLVTFALDDIDWDDEIRVFFEERTSFSPDSLTGMEANLRFVGPETMESKIFSRLTAWQNWIFQRPNAVGENGALRRYGTGQKAQFDMTRVSNFAASWPGCDPAIHVFCSRATWMPGTRPGMTESVKEHAMNVNIMNVDYSTKIPNNVNLSEDRQVLKALEGWHPGYMNWWSDMGPEGFQQSLVYLRTAYSVDPRGWAKFDYVGCRNIAGASCWRRRKRTASFPSASISASRPGRKSRASIAPCCAA